VGLARWLLEELPLAETRRVLDLGCGVGALLPHLDRVAPRALIVGLDRTEAMVALGPRDFPLLVGDAAELPFADGSFDAVVMAFMLFHLPRPTAGLAEAWRVLRPGGSVGLLTWGDRVREPGPEPVGRGARRRRCGRGRREAFLA
jgi:ubiquinone/menaquinone biosynthesis C-methylase UbiE